MAGQQSPNDHVPFGYHRLADLMGRHSETAIFGRFGDLNMLNILSLQAELLHLRLQFRENWDEDDRSTIGDEKYYSSYFLKLMQAEDSIQMGYLTQIREKLHLYSKLSAASDYGRDQVTGTSQTRRSSKLLRFAGSHRQTQEIYTFSGIGSRAQVMVTTS
jgi:hypothetical protein